MKLSPRYIVIHHSATALDASLADIRSAHLARGMRDVAYHFLIDSRGNILLGRDLSVVGEHARGINSESIGICCIGDYSKSPPRPACLEALIDLISKLRSQFLIPASNVIGHRDVAALRSDATVTICPGEELGALIGYIRERSQSSKASSEAREAAFQSGYDLEFLNLTHRWLDEWNLEVEVSVKNSGAIDWDLRDPEAAGVEITLSVVTHSGLSTSTSLKLIQKIVRVGLNGTARGSLDLSQLGPGALKFELLVNLPGKTARPIDLDLKQVTAPRSGGAIDTRYKCEIVDLIAQQQHDFLILVKGRVRNSGSSAWINQSRHEGNPFRLGMLTYAAATMRHSELLDEYRYELPQNCVLAGEEFAFQFEINSLRLPVGEVDIVVSMLREGEFWFHQRGSNAAQKRIEIPVRAPSSSLIQRSAYCLAQTLRQAKLLIIAPGLPLRDRDTGGRRLFEIIKALRDFGVAVTFVYENDPIFAVSAKYSAQLSELGVTVYKGPLELLARVHDGEFAACILCWHACAARYLEVLRSVLPKCKAIVDSVDVHWMREERGVKTGELNVPAALAANNKAGEVDVYARADEVWAVSENDRQAILLEIPRCDVKVISLMTDLQEALYSIEARDIIFVGGFNHPPNLGAALWGYQIVQEFRTQTGFEGRFYIVGDNPPEEIRALDDGRFTIVTGFVDDLTEFYKLARVMLAPIKYGAGVKGKITDAAAFALPILTTPLGNEGIGFVHGREAWICESNGEFVDALQQAFAAGTNLHEIGFAGRRRVLQATGKKSALSAIKNSIAAAPVVVSIVTFNQRELLGRCLNSLLEKTEFPNWRIALVSNGCTDGTAEIVAQLQANHPDKIDFYLNSENKFFVEPNNQIITRYSDFDVVLLNNDTEIIDNRWLYELHAAAYTSAMVGACGCLVLDSNGVVSEAGARIMQNGAGINFARGLSKASAEVEHFRYVGFVSGCCLYMRRDVIERFGLLDPEFQPMYYEDVEWQYRLHTFGLKTIWTPRASVQHTEGSSAGIDTNQGLKRFQEVNRVKFMEKYAGLDLDQLSK